MAVSPRSPWKDTLLTLVLKIDLGGVCAARHPMRPFVDALGLSQAWVDGILRTVSVLKATLEKEPEVKRRQSISLRCDYLSGKFLMDASDDAKLERSPSLVRSLVCFGHCVWLSESHCCAVFSYKRPRRCSAVPR